MIIRLHVRIGSSLMRNALAAALVMAPAGDLCSESVSLTTYYPAPSGAYSQLITTSNAFFARDGGSLTIGSAVPASASMRLAVMGNVGVQTANPSVRMELGGLGGSFLGLIANEKIQTGDASATNQGAVWFNSNAITSAKIGAGVYGVSNAMFGIYNGNNPSWGLTVSGINGPGAGNVGIYMNPTANTLDVAGTMLIRDSIGITCGVGQITPYSAVTGLATTNCPANTYATWASGLMTQYQYEANVSMISGNMLCCPCPTGSSCINAPGEMP